MVRTPARRGGAGGPTLPPTDPSELSFLSIDTRKPNVAEFSGGKTAQCLLRWVATTGEKGPWSETASATIGA